jgi:hypothetical protein
MRTLLLLVALAHLPACAYLKDRGLDFLDQFRARAGVGTPIGIRGKAGGLVDTGILVGVKPRAGALGWQYGVPLFFNTRDATLDADQAEIIKTTSLVGYDLAKASYDSAQESIAVVPALLTWTDATPKGIGWEVPEEGENFRDRNWLWSGAAAENSVYSRIHAFDFEFEIAILAYLDVGYSPGETLDFLLGLFTIDIADDDGRLESK